MQYITSLSEIINYLKSSETINVVLLLNNYIQEDTDTLELLLTDYNTIEQATLAIGFVLPNTIVLTNSTVDNKYASISINLHSVEFLGEARYYLHARLPYCFDVDEFDEKYNSMSNNKGLNVAQEICTIFRNDFSKDEYDKLIYMSLELLRFSFRLNYFDNIIAVTNKYKLITDITILNRILIEANTIYELYNKTNKIIKKLNKALNNLCEFVNIIKFDQGLGIYIVNRIEKTVVEKIIHFIIEMIKQIARQYYNIDLSTKIINKIIMYYKDFNETQFMIDNTILNLYEQISNINELI